MFPGHEFNYSQTAVICFLTVGRFILSKIPIEVAPKGLFWAINL